MIQELLYLTINSTIKQKIYYYVYMKNLFKQATAGLMTFVALDGYRRAVINDSKVNKWDRLLQDSINQFELAAKQKQEKENLLSSDNV